MTDPKQADTCVVAEDVDPAEPLYRRVDEPLGVTIVTHVGGDEGDAQTSGREGADEFVALVGTALRGDDSSAFGRKAFDDRAADTAPRACHDRRFPAEARMFLNHHL